MPHNLLLTVTASRVPTEMESKNFAPEHTLSFGNASYWLRMEAASSLKIGNWLYVFRRQRQKGQRTTSPNPKEYLCYQCPRMQQLRLLQLGALGRCLCRLSNTRRSPHARHHRKASPWQ